MPTLMPVTAGQKQSTPHPHLNHARRWMRTASVRELVRRIRRQKPAELRAKTPRGRRRKRKATLALSVAIITVGTTAYEITQPAAAGAMSISAESKYARMSANQMTASDALKEAIAEEEGVHLTVYADPIGKPTVGVGHLVRASDGLSIGDMITYDHALRLLESDLKEAENAVARLVGDLPLYQHEYDALVDLVFNVGEGTASKQNSPKLHAAIDVGDYAGMAAELAYHSAENAAPTGLVYRSDRRQAIFENSDYADPRPADMALAGAPTPTALFG